MKEYLLLVALLAIVHESLAQGSDFVINQRRKVSCYECNVFRGSYGIQCAEPMETWPKRDDCDVCMKISTTVREHYHKFKHLVSTVETRICVLDARDFDMYSGCKYRGINAGDQKECFCESNLCNSSNNVLASVWTSLLCVAAILFHRF